MSRVPDEHEQIKVVIGADGSVHAETVGIKGAACLDAITVLEDLLEATTVSSTYTDEYNEVGALTTTAQRQGTRDELRH